MPLEMLWGLDRASTGELVFSPRGPAERGWRGLRGHWGQPKAAVELASLGWRTQEWLERIEKRVRLILARLPPGHRCLLRVVVEDVDRLADYPELRERLIEYNLVTPVTRPCLGYTPPPDKELGVGSVTRGSSPATGWR